MTCESVRLPDGTGATICSRGKRPIKCRSCGRPGDRLCDWKVPKRKSGTCDDPICSRCSTSPAPDKDLCPVHAEQFERWKAARATGDPVVTIQQPEGERDHAPH